MQFLAACVAGLVFGVGLILAGMSNPAKVQGFLDLFGVWDPSLALVMGGAIGVGLLPFSAARRMRKAILGGAIGLPHSRQIDLRLIAGSAAFGIGWGLVGFCPGPALVALGVGEPKAFAFVAAMLAGMAVYELFSVRDRAAFERYAKLARSSGANEDG